MFACECLLDTLLHLGARDAARLNQTLELAQFLLRLAQRHRDAALLPLQHLLTLHDHQRAIQLPDRGAHPRRPHVTRAEQTGGLGLNQSFAKLKRPWQTRPVPRFTGSTYGFAGSAR
jgi:hypothetical protein